jgi:hypothetical protein
MAKTKKDSSWKNLDDYTKGKSKLKNAILQHPAEDGGDHSVYNYMKNAVQRNIWVSKFGDFENMGKRMEKPVKESKKDDLSEDMLGPMDSPSFTMQNPESPGSSYQVPNQLPGDNMDTFALAGPNGGDVTKTKKKKSGKRNKKSNTKVTNKVLTFSDFITGEG